MPVHILLELVLVVVFAGCIYRGFKIIIGPSLTPGYVAIFYFGIAALSLVFIARLMFF